MYIHVNVFFRPFGIFFSSGRGSFLVLSAPWHAGSPPGPRTQVWALAEVRATCSGGSKSQVRLGRDSEHVEPSRLLQTHVQGKRMTSHFIFGILNVINVKTILGDGKVFPRQNMPDMRPFLIQQDKSPCPPKDIYKSSQRI